MEIKYIDTPIGRVLGVETALKDIGEWHPTVTQVRKTILQRLIGGPTLTGDNLPPEIARYAPSSADVATISDACVAAVQAGRMIDFGHWPNAIIKQGGNRGGPPPPGGTTNHRYNLTFNASARNLFNNVNLATPVGTVDSPLFGRSNALGGAFGGVSQSANRRIDLQLVFNF